MAANSEISVVNMPLHTGAFSDLPSELSERQTKLGGPDEDERPPGTISLADLEVHIGNRPRCVRLSELYLKTHDGMPTKFELTDRFDVWLVTHVVGAVQQAGWKCIRSLEYQADFPDDEVYTVDLLPHPRFNAIFDASTGLEVDLQLNGLASAPEGVLDLLEQSEAFSADARLKLSSEVSFVGRLSLSLMTPIVQVSGLYHSRCSWIFRRDKKPLLNDQLMFQTLLVPQGTESIHMRIQGFAFIGAASFLPFPARFETDTLKLDIGPE